MISWQTPCIRVTVFFSLWLQLGKKKKHQSSKSFDHYIEFLLDHILTINYWLRKSPTIATCTGSERLKTPKTDYLLTDSRFCWPWKYMVECHHSTPSCHTEFFLPAYTFSQLVYLVSQVVLCLSSPLWFLRFISTILSWHSIPPIPHLGTLNILYIRHYGDKKKTIVIWNVIHGYVTIGKLVCYVVFQKNFILCPPEILWRQLSTFYHII